METIPENTKHGEPEQVLQPPPKCLAAEEFDPFTNAKPCSPFYLYNHDSPRPSTDHKSKPSLSVSIRDLEAGSETLTPSVSQEKIESNKTQPTSRLGIWRGQLLLKRQQCMTKPKQKTWLKSLPKRQRITVKALIAFLVIGCMVGIAVGLAVGLGSGVNKSNVQQGDQ